MSLKPMRMSNMAKISVSIMLGLQSLSVMAQGIQAQQLALEASSTPITIPHTANGLTQTQYQDLLNQYTQIVNDSKKYWMILRAKQRQNNKNRHFVHAITPIKILLKFPSTIQTCILHL